MSLLITIIPKANNWHIVAAVELDVRCRHDGVGSWEMLLIDK